MKSAPIKIIFARKSSVISKWIQKVTWSRWSHVAIVDGPDVIESQGIPPLKLILVLFGIIQNTPAIGGVHKTPLKQFIQTYPDHRFAYIDGDIDIARKMVGVTCYDAWGIIGIRFKKRIDCDDKMSCAKLVWVTGWCSFRQSMSYRATAQSILEKSRDTYDIAAQ